MKGPKSEWSWKKAVLIGAIGVIGASIIVTFFTAFNRWVDRVLYAPKWEEETPAQQS